MGRFEGIDQRDAAAQVVDLLLQADLVPALVERTHQAGQSQEAIGVGEQEQTDGAKENGRFG